MDEAKFWVVAFSAMALYGFMEWGGYAIPMMMGYDSAHPTLRDFISASSEASIWIPSFIAGVLARRRPVLLGVLTVVGGTLCTFAFRSVDSITAPLLTHITWQDPVVRPYAALLNIALSAVVCFAGQSLILRIRSKKLNDEQSQSIV